MPDVTRAALRVIIAIDSAAGLAKLAPHNPVRDLLGWHGADRAGLHFVGAPPADGEIVTVADCTPRPDQRPDWPRPTLANH